MRYEHRVDRDAAGRWTHDDGDSSQVCADPVQCLSDLLDDTREDLSDFLDKLRLPLLHLGRHLREVTLLEGVDLGSGAVDSVGDGGEVLLEVVLGEGGGAGALLDQGDGAVLGERQRAISSATVRGEGNGMSFEG